VSGARAVGQGEEAGALPQAVSTRRTHSHMHNIHHTHTLSAPCSYGDTAKMLAEVGVALGTRSAALPAQAFGCGFLTPATALGLPLIARLHETGMSFTEVPEEELAGMIARREAPSKAAGGKEKE
jgi:short subunit dehydrogenase-like uncharacterized protein